MAAKQISGFHFQRNVAYKFTRIGPLCLPVYHRHCPKCS